MLSTSTCPPRRRISNWSISSSPPATATKAASSRLRTCCFADHVRAEPQGSGRLAARDRPRDGVGERVVYHLQARFPRDPRGLAPVRRAPCQAGGPRHERAAAGAVEYLCRPRRLVGGEAGAPRSAPRSRNASLSAFRFPPL